VGQYESFLRRVMRRAPGAALLLVENFYFHEIHTHKLNRATNRIEQIRQQNPYHHTGDS
jgi:hypothetical protein